MEFWAQSQRMGLEHGVFRIWDSDCMGGASKVQVIWTRG